MDAKLDHVTCAEVAEKLGLTKPRVHQLIRAGRLPATPLGQQYVVSRADLAAFIRERRARQRRAAK